MDDINLCYDKRIMGDDDSYCIFLKTCHFLNCNNSYSLASPKECKLMRALVQINLPQFAVRSRGDRSHLQQGGDNQISSFDFVVLIPLIFFLRFDNGIQ